MELMVDTGEASLTLSKAILLYENSHRKGDFKYASVHEVRVSKRGGPEIMAGNPLSKVGLEEALSSLRSAQKDEFFGFIPDNVLSASSKHLVWWRPSQKSRVFFNCRELGKRSNITPQPSLLFSVIEEPSGFIWSIWALKGNQRPTPETMLHLAPYFNVYDSGSICVGSAQTPKSVSPGSLKQWEAAFFDSAFTHANGERKRSTHPKGDYALWKDLLDGNFIEFPDELLIEEYSVAKLLSNMQRSIKRK